MIAKMRHKLVMTTIDHVRHFLPETDAKVQKTEMLKCCISLKVDVKVDGENGLYFLRPFLVFNL